MHGRAGQNAGTALALGAFLDGIPEQAVLGIGIAAGKGAKSSRPSTRPAPSSALTSTVITSTPPGTRLPHPREVAATWKDLEDQSIPAA
jgi:hypothetical protein